MDMILPVIIILVAGPLIYLLVTGYKVYKLAHIKERQKKRQLKKM